MVDPWGSVLSLRFRSLLCKLPLLVLAIAIPIVAGCVHPTARGSGGLLSGRSQPLENPLFVPGQDDEWMWEQTIDVVHDYFAIAQENKIDGIIETEPKVGASLMEPWHRDSVGFYNRFESTLQSIRRRGFIHLTHTEGGYILGVEVYKELEDVKAGGASMGTFQQNTPLRRDLNVVVSQAPPPGWIVLGRDVALEQTMLCALRDRLARGPRP